MTWEQRFGALAEFDGDQWVVAYERLEQEWRAAYTAAFVEIAISRGWRRDDAVTWPVGIGGEAFIEAYLYDWDPRRAATADVVACEEPPDCPNRAGQITMARKPGKSRPTKIPLYFSDGMPHDVLKANRTKRRPMIVGYARTSTSDQTAGLEAQARDLKAVGVEKVFSEQVSSTAQRAKLAECLAFLRDGDVLTVTKPDRLARSTAELLSIEADLTRRGVGLVVLSMGGERLDTRKPTSKLMLTILAGVATWEREIMLERQREGIAKAKAAGKYKGRPPSIDRAKVRELLTRMGPAEVAKTLGVARSSIYRMMDA
jgi:DNA invertase Pin-like site-specific DNA recombinase